MKPTDWNVMTKLCKELYNNNWHDFRADLRRRLDEKPYIHKIHAQIDADLKQIYKRIYGVKA